MTGSNVGQNQFPEESAEECTVCKATYQEDQGNNDKSVTRDLNGIRQIVLLSFSTRASRSISLKVVVVLVVVVDLVTFCKSS